MFNFEKIRWIYLIIIALLHVIPLGNDLNLAVNNSYLFDGLRLDHMLHGMIFIPAYFFIQGQSKTSLPKTLIFLSITLTFAALCEMLQIVLPYRAFTIPDLTANLLGAFIGFSLVQIMHFFVFKK